MFKRLAISLLSAALLAGGATAAQAETAKKTTDFTVRGETSAVQSQQGTKSSLKYDARKGRWGVSFNLDQQTERDQQWNNVQAGAYFRVTPSLRVGGAVALGEKDQPAYKKEPVDTAPRVRLETAFKF